MGHLLSVMIADPKAQEKRRVPSWTAPITTVGRFATVEAAQVATDAVWAAR
jgi:hypothetical protein